MSEEAMAGAASALTVELGAIRVTSVTLVGVLRDKYPLKHGNCFSVLADDGKEYRVVNFVHENLEEACRRGISFPIAMRRISERAAVFHDSRIPDDWYSVRFCETCCPEHLLPTPQRLAHERQEMRGERETHEQFIRYDYTKRPTLEAPNAKVSGPEAALSPEGRARLPGSAAGDSERNDA